MKNKLSKILSTLIILSTTVACGNVQYASVETNLDFEKSNYKHINNGGVTDNETLPYNIDAITGATMTVEGPGVVTSIPLSIRELENHNDGLARGVYKDSNGEHTYEGLDLYYLLHDMVEGENGIILTDTAYRVDLKNANRETIATLTLKDIETAHKEGRPILLAYGIGDKTGSTVAPFVFDAATDAKEAHSLGYIDSLDNEDGCIKLVYDNKTYGDGSYKTFVNVAYVYLKEEKEPGFKHTGTSEDSFGSSRYLDYVLTFTGSGLGNEIDLTVEQLESLVTYDKNGNIIEGGIGYSDWYSLANNAYWYVNEYEGLDLYKLLMYLGMKDAETMGLKAARTTLVSFIASDGVASSETFSVDTLSYPDGFGFYKKNANDDGTGTYIPTNSDLVGTGYPVLLSYGVNNYPYTISKTDDAYVSGLSNSGGPFRVVFGKTQYNHPNGSNQVQQVSQVIVGNLINYNTHKYTTESVYNAVANNEIKIKVISEEGKDIINSTITVGDVEDIIYGENVTAEKKKQAKVKSTYVINNEKAVYEGVDLEYFLLNYLGLPGTNGNITFTSSNGSKLTLTLENVMKNSIISFAKNGSPLVKDKSSLGYKESIDLNTYLSSDASEYIINNIGGPLLLITNDNQVLEDIVDISVTLIPDSYAHTSSEYAKYQNSTIKFTGPGLANEKTYTVAEIESKQIAAKTLDYSMLDSKGNSSMARYRGVAIYDLFKEVGIKNNASDVIVKCSDGSEKTYSLMLLKKSYQNYLDSSKDNVYAMIAYGVGDINGEKINGTPLTSDNGGPLMLVVPQESADSKNKSLCLKDIVSIYVGANEITTWSHSMSDVYSEFLDETFTLKVKNDDHEVSKVLTVKQLEDLVDLVVRDNYTVLDIGTCEGIDLWQLYTKYASKIEGYDAPISFTVYANDGYKNDLLSNIYLTGLKDGVSDENGNTKRVILCYAINGYPCVNDEGHEGYTGLAGNMGGPMRVVVENFQGGSVKYCNQLVVTISGSGEIKLGE